MWRWLTSALAFPISANVASDEKEKDAPIWDFIVVGAGTGGSLCAARLARSGATVLLVEAGGWDEPSLYDPDAEAARGRNNRVNSWLYPSRLAGHLSVQNDEAFRQTIMSGKLVGGTSSVHNDIYDPPVPTEFALMGLSSWDATMVSRALGRIEEDMAVKVHPLSSDLMSTFLEETLGKGLGLRVHVGGPSIDGTTKAGVYGGWGRYRMCTSHDREAKCSRHTSYSFMIASVNDTSAVTTLTHALVSRVLIEKGEAVGVEIIRHGRRHEVFASRAVVLAAGALGTPKILTLSGIGHPLDLQRLGVPVVVPNREVGYGLADHLAYWFQVLLTPPQEYTREACEFLEKFYMFLNITGPAGGGEGPVEGEMRFFRICNNLDPKSYGYAIEAVLLSPESRGRVVVQSADPEILPIAEVPNLWESDFVRLRDLTMRFAELLQFPDADKLGSRPTLLESVKADAYLYQHMCCSARAAPEDAPGVLHENLEVRGIPGLYVADTSALPAPPSCHTSSTALLVGELAAQFILEAQSKWRPVPVRAGKGSKAEVLAEGVLHDTEANLLSAIPSVLVPSQVPKVRAFEMPRFVLGTGTMRKERVAEAVASFLQLGGRHLDTAAMYDNYQQIVEGISLSGVADVGNIVVTAKTMPMGAAAVRGDISAALNGLGRAYLDIALLHWPGDTNASKLLHGKPLPTCAKRDGYGVVWRDCRIESYRALMEERDAGRVLAIGVSNFWTGHLTDLETEGLDIPAVHQMEVHPAYSAAEVLEMSRIAGTRIQAYGCLGGPGVLNHPVVDEVAKRLGVSRALVLYRWVLQLYPQSDATIVSGSSSKAHMRENMGVFNFELSEADMQLLDGMAKQSGNFWKVYQPMPSMIL